MMVVVLGPDGSGKSTIIREVSKNLADVFKKVEYFHLRPRLLPGRQHVDREPVTDPHGQTSYNRFVSLLKLVYFVVIYRIGYLTHWMSMRSPDELMIFDRYYHDLIVDPKRFRYGHSEKLARIFGGFIPQPNLFVLLDAPVAVLQDRKREVSEAECARQRLAYLNLMSQYPHSVVVNTVLPLSEVVEEVSRHIRQTADALSRKKQGQKQN